MNDCNKSKQFKPTSFGISFIQGVEGLMNLEVKGDTYLTMYLQRFNIEFKLSEISDEVENVENYWSDTVERSRAKGLIPMLGVYHNNNGWNVIVPDGADSPGECSYALV